MQYTIYIAGPDHDAIAKAFGARYNGGRLDWVIQPLGLYAKFRQDQTILAHLGACAHAAMTQMSNRNTLSVIQMPEPELSWLGSVRELQFCGSQITGMHIPDARINEDDPDLADACQAVMDRMAAEPFLDDHEFLRFLNQRPWSMTKL